jgi:hypothetical protein
MEVRKLKANKRLKQHDLGLGRDNFFILGEGLVFELRAAR